MPDEPTPTNDSPIGSSSRGYFATTSWSLIVKAADGHSSESRIALESLCQTYWYPLYAFVRRRGNEAVAAEDLTQSFFVFLLEKDRLQTADQSRGRFRTFLLSALNNFMKNEWRKESAQKRGGGRQILSIDFDVGEARYKSEPFHSLTPEKIFERSWAMTLLGRTFDELAQKYSETGKTEIYESLKPYLAGQGDVAYAEIAEQLNMSEGSVKVAVHRMRKTCREVLREQISQTVESNDEIDAEINELFEIMQE